MLPLPETDPNRMVPSALGQQSRRVSTIEPGSLPTPRSYRYYTDGVIGVTSGTDLLDITPAGVDKMWINPGEVFQFYVEVSVLGYIGDGLRLRLYSAELGTILWFDHTYPSAGIKQAYTRPSTTGVFGSSPDGEPVTVPTLAFSSAASPRQVDPVILAQRASGSGEFTIRDLRMNVLIY